MPISPPFEQPPRAHRPAFFCRTSGIALIFVPELPATRVHGATRWLTPQKALLQLSSRGKTDDFLWFAFFHEAADILKHGKREVFIEAPDGTHDQEARCKEDEADTFASDFLIPKTAFAHLRQRQPFTTETVKRFAAELGIAPSIVVGRLQHEKLLPFTHLNALKRRFSLASPTRLSLSTLNSQLSIPPNERRGRFPTFPLSSGVVLRFIGKASPNVRCPFSARPVEHLFATYFCSPDSLRSSPKWLLPSWPSRSP